MSYNESDMSSNESTSDSIDQLVDADKENEVVNSKTKKYNVNTSQNFSRLVNTFWYTILVFVFINLN